MNTETHEINVNGLLVEVVRKPIKNLHLGVYPPNGRVRVATPLLLNDDAVRLAVIAKLGWIKRQIEKFENQPRQSKREMIDSESHYFLGNRYRINVIEHEGESKIVLRNSSMMDLYVRHGSEAEKREKLLQDWYRDQLKKLVPPLLEKWKTQVNIPVVNWGIKRMKTKWGSCNVENQRIWINLELAKKPFQCLEYIVVHELVHFLQRHHDDQFTGLMDRFLPDWRLQREELNRAPLAYENWDNSRERSTTVVRLSVVDIGG